MSRVGEGNVLPTGARSQPQPSRAVCSRPRPTGTRDGVMFLREHSISIPLAQRVADKWGSATRALVERDPYAALAGLGLSFA